ncbi:MAG: sulfotransferase [Rhodobacter sp.]|nr:sulfotransferase [Rhodobacter sp.]
MTPAAGISLPIPPGRVCVFVIGCQRSGTTLAGQILGAHPRAMLIDETDRLYRWAGDPGPGGQTGAPAERGDFTGLLTRAAAKYTTPETRFENGNLAETVTHLVFQAPNLTWFPGLIGGLANPVHVVAMVRDPRAVAASMARLGVPMVRNQIRWLRAAGLAADFAADLALLEAGDVAAHIKHAVIWRLKTAMADRFAALGLACHRLRYEALVAESGVRIAALARDLGLPPSDRMLAHHTVLRGRGPGRTQRGRAVDRGSLQGWQAHLPPEAAAETLTAAGPLARAHGYVA